MAQMEQAEIYSQLTTIFRNLFDEDSIVLTPETTAADIEGWDSFNHINLIVAVEVKFGIKFKTAELDELHNVGHLVDMIQRKLAAKG
jgi:acyl carrier protein